VGRTSVGDDTGAVLHASCVAFDGAGVLILGPSGAGKSTLALQLMALGAALVADDRTALAVDAGRVRATAPPGLPACIEARGIGLLAAPLAGPVPLALVVDLGRHEAERLPPRRTWHWGQVAVDCIHGPATGYFPAAIRQYVIGGRVA
jgi:HPr kinase/phosphorylase